MPCLVVADAVTHNLPEWSAFWVGIIAAVSAAAVVVIKAWRDTPGK